VEIAGWPARCPGIHRTVPFEAPSAPSDVGGLVLPNERVIPSPEDRDGPAPVESPDSKDDVAYPVHAEFGKDSPPRTACSSSPRSAWGRRSGFD